MTEYHMHDFCVQKVPRECEKHFKRISKGLDSSQAFVNFLQGKDSSLGTAYVRIISPSEREMLELITHFYTIGRMYQVSLN